MDQKIKGITISRREVHHCIFNGSCLALVFFIPVSGRVVPPVIVIMVLNWLIEGKFIKNLLLVPKEPVRWKILLFALFYLAYFTGIFYSENKEFGWFDLKVKFSMFLFPIVFATMDFPAGRRRIRHLFTSFIAGCFAGSLVLIGRAVYEKAVNGAMDPFVYTNLSWFFHPSYLAMYFTFAISALFFFLADHWSKLPGIARIGIILLVLWFFGMIILLGSRAGYLGLFVAMVFCSLVLGFRHRQWMIAALTLLTTIFLFYSGFELIPFAANRVSQAGQVNKMHPSGNGSNSIDDRIRIISACRNILVRNPVFGVGTGDVKDALLAEYKKENFTTGFEQKLNAHNQYLQTFVALGVVGLFVLMMIIAVPAVISFRKGYFLYFSFLLIVAVNLVAESMFEIQQGIVFYSFFNTCLFWSMEEGDRRV